MNKLILGLISILTYAAYAQDVSHVDNLNGLIKHLRLKTHRAELIDTPALLQSIISELYCIQSEFQSLSIFTHQILQNLSDTTASFNAISEQLNNLIPERQIQVTLKPKQIAAKKNTSLSRTLKTLEKYHISLTKHMRDIATVNTILHAVLSELETLQNDINTLAHTVRTLAFSYHHQAKDLFAVALKLFTLTGIESDTGPYLCEADQINFDQTMQ